MGEAEGAFENSVVLQVEDKDEHVLGQGVATVNAGKVVRRDYLKAR